MKRYIKSALRYCERKFVLIVSQLLPAHSEPIIAITVITAGGNNSGVSRPSKYYQQYAGFKAVRWVAPAI